MTAPVLVTGATGFVGGALVRRLVAAGHAVLCPVRRADPRLAALPGVTLVETPLHDADLLRAALRGHAPGRVVHLAAAGVRLDERGAQSLVDGNVRTVAALLQVAADAQWPLQRFVHVGSCAEYGLVAPAPVTEDAPLRPVSAYGGAKAAASVMALGLAAALGIPLTVARLFGTFGTGEAPQRLLPYVITQLQRGQACRLTPGDQVRDLTWIGDVTEALLRVAEADVASGTTLHICSGQARTVREVVERMADLAGAPRALLHWGALPHRPDEPRVLVGDPSRLQQLTGWRARTDLDTALGHMLAAATSAREPHALV